MSVQDEIKQEVVEERGFDAGLSGARQVVPERWFWSAESVNWERGYRRGCEERLARKAQRPAPRPWKQQPYQNDHGASIAIVCGGNDPHIVALIGPKNVDDDPDYYTAKRYPHDYANARVLECAGEAYDLLKELAEFFAAGTPVYPGSLIGDDDRTAKELVLDLVRRMDGGAL